jgi:hypothetical protein
VKLPADFIWGKSMKRGREKRAKCKRKKEDGGRKR